MKQPNKRSIQIPLTTRARVSRDVQEELQVHLSMRVEELVRSGMAREEAERQARAQFGDVDAATRALVDEDMRRVTRTRQRLGLESWAQDTKYALRQLVRQRVFSVVALLTLALGTGVTMAIFSVVDAILLRPLPYEQPAELVRLYSVVRGNRRSFSVPDFYDYRQQTKTLRAIASYYDGTTNYVDKGNATRVVAASTSDNFFGVLEIAPIVGRTFVAGEDATGAPQVVVLNESLWRSMFGADPSIVGRTMHLDGEASIVIGVVPSAQAYPLGTDLWVTHRFSAEEREADQRGARWIGVIGRLAPGATIGAAQTEVSGVAGRLAQLDSAHNRNVGVAVVPLQESMVGNMEKPLFTLLVAVALVLLIATVNVANLSLARTMARESELAVRAALGAGQRRLMRQLVTESAVLGVIGTLLGLALAHASLGALIAIAPADLPRLDAVRIDAHSYLVAAALAALGGLAIGLVPALHVGHVSVAQRLRDGARGLVRAAAQRRRQALVVGEVALAVMLLVGAGLMVRTLGALRRVDPGFSADNVYMFTVTLPEASYRTVADQHRFAVNAEQRLRAIPGVTDVGLAFALPLTDGRFSLTFTTRGRPPQPAGQDMSAQIRIATAGYFSVLKLPLKRGRLITTSDVATAPPVIVISEELARRYFPNEDPLGLYLQTGWGRDSVRLGGTVVGIVGDVRSEALSEPAEPFIYVPEPQWPFDEPTFVMRTAGSPEGIAAATRETMRALDGTLPIFDARPFASVVSASVGRERFLVRILSLFSLLAVVLSAIGIYGVVAYGVEQRRRELGVRIALGASRDRVLALILKEGVRLALIGGVLGVAGAIALTRFLEAVLYQVKPTDPLTIVSVTLALLAVAIAASVAPAVRAARLQPTVALKEN